MAKWKTETEPGARSQEVHVAAGMVSQSVSYRMRLVIGNLGLDEKPNDSDDWIMIMIIIIVTNSDGEGMTATARA